MNGFCVIHVEKDHAGQPIDWTYLYVNETLAQMEGKSPEELVGHRFFEMFPDRDRKRLKPHFEAAYLGKSRSFDDVSEEIGCCVHVDVYPTGEPGCCACVLQKFSTSDTMEDQQSRELNQILGQLEEERRINARIKDFAGTMGMVYPLAISIDYGRDSYQIVEYNNFLDNSEFLSGSIDELIRTDAATIPDADAAIEFWTLFNRENVITAFRQGSTYVAMRHPKIGKDGKIHHMYTAVICAECDAKEIKGIALSRCIDDEVVKEQAAKREEKHRETVDALSTLYIAIMEADIQTRECHFVKIDSVLGDALNGNMIGNFDQILQSVFMQFIEDEMRETMSQFLNLGTVKERLSKVNTISTEYKSTLGYWREARIIAKKRDDSGCVVSVLYVMKDITWEKEQELLYMEQLRKAANEAEQANLSKTNFLRRMSHDIRTPLNGIIGMLKIIDDSKKSREECQDYMNKIMRSADYLLSIVNNVLDISKMESGDIELEYRPFDLGQLLLNTLPIVATNASQNSVVFLGGEADTHIQHRYVIGSPVHLNRILMNVASNAVKYNRSGGSLKIYCNELESDGQKAVYEFVCEDTGLGMSDAFQRKAFEPFTQEGKPTTTSYSGSGLGLSIVKKIVDKMGGNVTIHSKEGVGTTVRIVLTMTLDQHPEESLADEGDVEELDLTGRKALLVEDNEINMEIATILLEAMGLELTCVWNGQQAVDTFMRAEAYTYDFIFMDMMMPVMDGLEATRVIRKLPKVDATTVPIIAMTANAFSEDRKACLDAGMDDHIGKPIDSRELTRLLRKYA